MNRHDPEPERDSLVGRHPRRAKAEFTAAKDHNPLVLQDCPDCSGSGKRDRHRNEGDGGGMWELCACDVCGGTGITGQIEHYFLTDAPEVSITPDANGWLRCPGCGIVFSTHDQDRWTGYRHLRCGQRIRISASGV